MMEFNIKEWIMSADYTGFFMIVGFIIAIIAVILICTIIYKILIKR